MIQKPKRQSGLDRKYNYVHEDCCSNGVKFLSKFYRKYVFKFSKFSIFKFSKIFNFQIFKMQTKDECIFCGWMWTFHSGINYINVIDYGYRRYIDKGKLEVCSNQFTSLDVVIKNQVIFHYKFKILIILSTIDTRWWSLWSVEFSN